MLVSLAIYVGGRRTLPPDSVRSIAAQHGKLSAPLETAALASGQRGYSIGARAGHSPEPVSSTRAERRAVAVLVGVCALVTLFWAAYDQQGNTIVLWAEDFTNRSFDLAGWPVEIPSPWFLALNPLMIFLLTPLIVRLWALQGARGTEASPVGKMAFGCLCLAAANLLMAAAAATSAGKTSPLWLVGYFLLATLGELHLAPIGLALISRLAPARVLSLMMGVWFAATLPADILGGYLGGFWSRMAKADFFLMIAAIAAVAGIALWAFQRLALSASRDRGA
jgi:POT family proton-dependent oligopeptide transporter